MCLQIDATDDCHLLLGQRRNTNTSQDTCICNIEHGQDVQIFVNDQHGQIIVITVVVEGATGQHGQVDWGQQLGLVTVAYL